MNGENNLQEQLRQRMAQLSQVAPGTIGDQLQFRLLEPEGAGYRMACQTARWMANAAGTLHGGLGATILDQAMGFLAFCLMPGPGFVPTVQMSVQYHRPLIPGQEVLVKVQVVTAGKHLIHLQAEAGAMARPEQVCLSATGVYFYRQGSQ